MRFVNAAYTVARLSTKEFPQDFPESEPDPGWNCVRILPLNIFRPIGVYVPYGMILQSRHHIADIDMSVFRFPNLPSSVLMPDGLSHDNSPDWSLRPKEQQHTSDKGNRT
jgi:hypothetical protein